MLHDIAGEPPGMGRWKFDYAAVITVEIMTRAGEAAVRAVAATLNEINLRGGDVEADDSAAPDATFELVAAAPRGRAWLVEATGPDGSELAAGDPPMPGLPDWDGDDLRALIMTAGELASYYGTGTQSLDRDDILSERQRQVLTRAAAEYERSTS